MSHITQKMNDQSRDSHSPRLWLFGIMFLAALSITACGGGASNSANPGASGDGSGSGGGFTYNPSNPPARSADVTAFQVNLFNFIASNTVCAQCHAPGGSGAGAFANPNDVNLAYDAARANGRVNLEDPASSLMVTKFRSAGGHVCWLPTNEDCAQRLETWITNWRDDQSGTGARTISLRAPNSVEPQAAIGFPATPPPSFTAAGGVHDLVSTFCVRCHTPMPASEPAQSPFFGQLDAAASYQVITSTAGLVNLIDPNGSRLYERLIQQHNCWDTDGNPGGDCPESASRMLTAINAMVTEIQAGGNQVDLSQKIVSRAVNLFDDGIAASGGDRYEANMIALYEFKERNGRTVADNSSVAPSADLILEGEEGVDFSRLSSWGVRFMHGNAVPPQSVMGHSIAEDTSKIARSIASTGEYSYEMWVIPDDITQMNRTIVSYSASSAFRNFDVSQYGYEYRVTQTTSNSTDTNGENEFLGTDEGAELLQASLQHVVVTYDAQNGRKVYINGVDSGAMDPETPAGLNWNDGYAITIGNSFDGNRPWHGIIKMLAIHDRALSLSQIQQNFSIDVGQKYYLMFDVSEHLSACQGPDVNMSDTLSYNPLCFVYAEAAQFDDFSYLINQPKFISLAADPSGIYGTRIKGIRIGVNGREAESGQAFVAVDTTISVANGYDPAEGQLLSNIGTIVASEFGPFGDPRDFLFMTFEILGGDDKSAQYVEVVDTTLPAVNPAPVSDVMIRSFEEINASMAQITGVDRTISDIGGANGTYTGLITGLPGTSDVNTFVSAHQMAIAQLAIEYCNARINNVSNTLTIPTSTYFPDAGISGAITNGTGLAFTDTEREQFIDPILERVNNATFNPDRTVNTELLTQASTVSVRNELKSLIGTLTSSCGGTCTPARTQEVMKATCSAAIANAAMLLQ